LDLEQYAPGETIKLNEYPNLIKRSTLLIYRLTHYYEVSNPSILCRIIYDQNQTEPLAEEAMKTAKNRHLPGIHAF
jgi:hypothetical protein